ncbi:Rab geranylgeranyltransferase [Oleoguttula sp. CCFEE 5521]
MSLAAGPGRGRKAESEQPLELVVDKHVAYVQALDTRRDELEYHLTEHLRISGIYWGLVALHLLGQPDALPRDGLIEYVLSCWCENGGFGAAPGHDAHILYTTSAVQILAMTDGFAELKSKVVNGKRKIADFVAGLQQSDGTFAGDEWGELDTRFMACAFITLSLLGYMPAQRPDESPVIDVDTAVSHIRACQNFDGAFGLTPGAESHSGQVFACLAALSIADALEPTLPTPAKDRLGAWLSERQQPSGGLNGRPEKLVDVCYSWWVMSSMSMIGRLHWIDQKKLGRFILECQDPDEGGIADRPGDMVDVFHLCFGVAGLSLVEYEGLVEVDPA